MALLKNKVEAPNSFTFIADDQAIPATGDIIVTIERWENDAAQLAQHDGLVGVQIEGHHDVRELADVLVARPLIALHFPALADGRNYTHARVLREQLGYTGELRARGDVQRDQLYYLWRCGINAMELSPNVPLASALAAFRDFSVTYQPAADEPDPLFRRVG